MVFASVFALGACGGSDDNTAEADAAPGIEPAAECEGDSVVALQGTQRMVFSGLSIGTQDDGFDLNGDGEPDNKFAGVASLAAEPIADAFADFSLVLPMEFFDFPEVGEDDCVKFAIYQGEYRLDGDGDNKDTARDEGDCNDLLATVAPGLPEIAGNGIDDDCDGLADETEEDVKGTIVVTPSDDVADADQDGVTLADGDCDDTNELVFPGNAETCGDGLDNNCDGVADWTVGAAEAHCSPFDSDLDPLHLTPESFGDGGEPQIAFKSGTVSMVDGVLRLKSGPSLFALTLPIVDDVELELRITGTTIEADLVMSPDGWTLQNGRLGGVLDTYTMDQVRGLDIEQIGLRPEDSLADAMYANVLGILLGLRKAEAGTPGEGCLTPDIDVDGDGLEAFCDTTPEDEPFLIDRCVDGDGTVVLDEGTECSSALDADGNRRFVDGVSIAITFETVPADLPTTLN